LGAEKGRNHDHGEKKLKAPQKDAKAKKAGQGLANGASSQSGLNQ